MSTHESQPAEATVTAVDEVVPIDHAEALRLARTEHRTLGEVIDAIGPDDWDRPTDCSDWTVRDLTGHVVGTFMASASLVEMVRQQIRTKRRGGSVDDYTAQQVERVADLGTAELVDRFHRLEQKAVTGRGRMPGFIRDRAKIPPAEVNGQPEAWTFSYLLGPILLRDAFMHRIDLSRAIGRELRVDPEHDGRIVADVVAEWCRRHGRPVELVLSGAAGGRFRAGAAGEGPTLELDAIELCRTLSGRAEPTHELLQTEVPF